MVRDTVLIGGVFLGGALAACYAGLLLSRWVVRVTLP